MHREIRNPEIQNNCGDSWIPRRFRREMTHWDIVWTGKGPASHPKGGDGFWFVVGTLSPFMLRAAREFCQRGNGLKTGFLEADGKCPYARLPKSRGMRRTKKYAAVPPARRDEG